MYQSLINEYRSLLYKEKGLEDRIHELPRGYISTKKINGKNYSYCQYRVNEKVVSQYVPSNHIDDMKKQIKMRKEYQAELQQLHKKRKQIESVAFKLNKGLISCFNLLEASIGMDELNIDERYKSLSFADAINAIEGVPINQQTAKELSQWAEKKQSYYDVCINVLKNCGVVLEDE